MRSEIAGEPGLSLRFGPLDAIIRADGVSDVTVTPDGRVWVDEGAGMREVAPAFPFESPQVVKEYAIRLCAQLGRRLDSSCPIADASAPSGLRVHAVIEPIVPAGASISIRLPAYQPLSLADLEECGFMPPAWVGLLRGLIRRRASLVISGGTGTGKTSLLRSLLAECPASERIVTVEEIREIGGWTPGNRVSLACRESNVEGAGSVDLSQLVNATLRMRPDRIVLGECRGREVADLLRAFNSGHRGGLVTLHANGVEQIPQRLVALGQLGGLSIASLSLLAQGAFDAVVHLERRDGTRRIAQIGCMGDLSAELGSLRGRLLASWDGSGSPITYPGWSEFADKWGRGEL